MRVALLSRGAHPLHEPGGMERAVFHLARHLQARGVETVLFTRPRTRAGAFPGEVVTLPYGPERAHGRVLDRTLRYPRFSARLGAAVAARVRTGEVDVVDAQGLCALGYGRARKADPRLLAPLVMNPQGMEEHRTRGLKRLALARLRALSREAARLADRVVATDEATRQDVPLLLGVEASKVVVLPNGFDPDDVSALTPADPAAFVHAALPGLAGAAPLFLSVGRLEPYKGFGDTLAALERAHAGGLLGDRWAWVAVGAGRGTGAEPDVPAGLSGHIHFTGHVADDLLHALYARADAFVHATRFEGSSLVTLEAMAHGLPVIATRAGGIPDKVVDGETGYLVEPGDRALLAERLGRVARAPDEARRMGARGRARGRERFAWPVLVERTIALYSELMGAARAGAGRP
ncbi:MAG TPA: glycosyltransferase family 4 protein [Vicinamibacteria bacterium]|nr:glycosyltransferase family 4 protein [Vicinamibacteria bacterium]